MMIYSNPHSTRLVRLTLGLGLALSSTHFLPARTLWVNQAASQASDTVDQASSASAGTEEKPFRTISAAAALAQPGDTVFVQPGIYREQVSPARGGTVDAPITYQAAPGHRVFVRGSEEWKPAWQPLPDHPGVFTASLDARLFTSATRNPYLTSICIAGKPVDLPARPASAYGELTQTWLKDKEPGRRPRTLGQLFVDGVPLREAETRDAVLSTPGTWIVNDAGDGLVVHFFTSSTPLADRLVELTVRDRIFAPASRGLAYIVVRGFVFEHAANQGPFPQLGAVSLRSGSSWLVEDNIIRHAKTLGIDAGSETWAGENLVATEKRDQRLIAGKNNIVRGNEITDNGLCGLAAWNCTGLIVENNRVERNNALGFHPGADHHDGWEEHAGIKLHSATGARIEGNLVRDNDAHGIWIDNGFTNARVTRNVVLNNAGAGIMMEMGFGPCLVDQNVVAYTRAYNGYYAGDGIYGHDASNITVAHNLSFANARYGVFYQRITNRNVGGKLVEASGLRVLNNLLFDNSNGAINLPAEGERTHDNTSDYNIVSQRGVRFIANQGESNPVSGDLATQLRKQLLGEAATIASRKDYAGWSLLDGLTLAEWRGLTGRDAHTEVENPKCILIRPHTQEIELLLGPAAHRAVPPVTVSDSKFPGAPLPAGGQVFPGPWQNLGETNQRFFLWPLSD